MKKVFNFIKKFFIKKNFYKNNFFFIPGTGGYYLSHTHGNCDYRDKKIMLNIIVFMDQWLSSQIDMIECYDSTGFLAQYSSAIKKPYYEFRFLVNENLMNTELKIYFK